MEKANLDKKSLKKFGITMGTAFFIITIIILIRHRHNVLFTLAVSIIFFILSFIAPALLKPIYFLWMKLAFILGWINTRLILFAMFYLIFTPIGLGLKLFKVDLLDRKIEKDKKSYWRRKEKEKFSPLSYERQF